MSGEIVSIIFLRGRKLWTDLTDVKRKKIFVSVSPQAEIGTKSATGNGQIKIDVLLQTCLVKIRQTNPTFEVEYNIDNKRDVLSSGKKYATELL